MPGGIRIPDTTDGLEIDLRPQAQDDRCIDRLRIGGQRSFAGREDDLQVGRQAKPRRDRVVVVHLDCLVVADGQQDRGEIADGDRVFLLHLESSRPLLETGQLVNVKRVTAAAKSACRLSKVGR